MWSSTGMGELLLPVRFTGMNELMYVCRCELRFIFRHRPTVGTWESVTTFAAINFQVEFHTYLQRYTSGGLKYEKYENACLQSSCLPPTNDTMHQIPPTRYPYELSIAR